MFAKLRHVAIVSANYALVGARRARASRRSVLTFRVRVAYIGAKLGSATMTS